MKTRALVLVCGLACVRAAAFAQAQDLVTPPGNGMWSLAHPVMA